MNHTVARATTILAAPCCSLLLLAYVAQQYPNAMNVGASFKPMAAPEVGIRKGAEDLLRQLK